MLNRFIIAAAAVVMTTPLAMAGPIDSACVRSDRARGNAPLCGCIQQVANQTLSRSDQRQARQVEEIEKGRGVHPAQCTIELDRRQRERRGGVMLHTWVVDVTASSVDAPELRESATLCEVMP